MLAQHALHSEKHAIDRWILWLVIILAMLPFGQVFYLRLGFVTLSIFEQLYLVLMMVLTAKILCEKRVKYPLALFLFSSTVIISVLLSSTIGGVPATDALRQMRFYLPFLVATLLLAADIRLPLARYLNLLMIASVVSSLSALYIHHVAPDFLASCFVASEEVQDTALIHGRLYWVNSHLTLFVLLCVFLRLPGISRPMVLLAFAISFAAAFNTSSRTVLAGCVLFILGALITVAGLRQAFSRIALVTTLVLLSAIPVCSIYQEDERVRDLIDRRFFGSGDVENVYERAVMTNRMPYYEQYLESFRRHFPVGQGLGRPLSVASTHDIFISDVSFISFLLPFGAMGILLFGVFVMKLVTLIRRAPAAVRSDSRNLFLLLLVVSLLMSLNMDLFSRHNFVIHFTLLVMMLQNQTPLDTKKRHERRYVQTPYCRRQLRGLRT